MLRESLLILFVMMNCATISRSFSVRMFRGAQVSKMILTKPRCFQTTARLLAPPVVEMPTPVDFMSIKSEDKSIQFGDYGLIASQGPVSRTFVETKDLGTARGPAVGETVWIRGRIASVRAKGNACFLVIRAGSFYTVQACHFKDKENPDLSKAMIKFVSSIPLESIVDIQGVIAPADVKSCSQKNVELQIQKIFAVSRAPVTLPFLLDDAARSEHDIEASQGNERPLAGVAQVTFLKNQNSMIVQKFNWCVFSRLQQDVRLNNRWLDLRVPANNAIMRVRSGISLLFREALSARGFVEINTPKLIAGESEGGSEVFRTDYFGKVQFSSRVVMKWFGYCLSLLIHLNKCLFRSHLAYSLPVWHSRHSCTSRWRYQPIWRKCSRSALCSAQRSP